MPPTESHPDTGDDGASRELVSPYLVIGIESLRPTVASTRLSILEVSTVAIGRGDARRWRRAERGGARELAVELPDRWLSTRHARLTGAGGRWTLEDLGSKNGTSVNGARVRRARLADNDVIEVGSTLLLFRDRVSRRPGEPGDYQARDSPLPRAMHTLSPPLWRHFSQLARIARTDQPILITGETGTGKELTARAIHEISSRTGPFQAINCAALTQSLVESELFGHRRGAFTGAGNSTTGLIRAADRGTLFLDEVAELPPSSQAKLLRVLEEHSLVPVGEANPVSVDVRVVAATQDLDARVAAGEFRQDLHARLAGFHAVLPPLRERREDLGLLVSRILPGAPGGNGLAFERAAARALYDYDWPSNIRELRNTLHAAAAIADDGTVRAGALPARVREQSPNDERARLVRVLRAHGGNVTRAAADLGTSQGAVRRKAKRYGIDINTFRRG
jgi:DNA-binding NtrC family response regulator